MEKHLLVTTSGDPSSLYGVRFVGSFIRNKRLVRITLLYVTPTLEREKGSASGHVRHQKDAGADATQVKAQQALDSARKMLCDRGFPPENISTKLAPRQFGAVKDIIREGRAGKYDAVILGRRGYTMFESILSTSVSKDMLSRDVDFPIWICRLPEENRKDVLLCTDGSQSSLRMADHVGFMLEDEEEHSVTIFYVDTGEIKNVSSIVEQAVDMLKANGLPESRIGTKVVQSSNVAKSVLEEAHANSYAVVAMGRVGLQKGAFKELMVGSRTMKLLDNIEKAALWVSS